MSTPLAALARFARPGPSPEVEDMLRALIGRLGSRDADRVLRYCPKTRARRVSDLPAWVRAL